VRLDCTKLEETVDVRRRQILCESPRLSPQQRHAVLKGGGRRCELVEAGVTVAGHGPRGPGSCLGKEVAGGERTPAVESLDTVFYVVGPLAYTRDWQERQQFMA
jgi:hypothetical protein